MSNTIGWPDWATQGACRATQPKTDVPEGHLTPAARSILRDAITTCGSCTVLDDCRQWAAKLRWAGVVIAGVCYGENGRPSGLCRRCKRPLIGMRQVAEYCGGYCRGAHAREMAAA